MTIIEERHHEFRFIYIHIHLFDNCMLCRNGNGLPSRQYLFGSDKFTACHLSRLKMRNGDLAMLTGFNESWFVHKPPNKMYPCQIWLDGKSDEYHIYLARLNLSFEPRGAWKQKYYEDQTLFETVNIEFRFVLLPSVKWLHIKCEVG